MGGRGSSSGKASGGGTSGKAKASGKQSAKISGDVSFPEIINASPNAISFSKIVTISPKGYMPESGKKGDLGYLVDKYKINEVVMHTRRGRVGANDLKRMQDLGFKIQAQYKDTQEPGTATPPMDYYYMIRK